MRIKERQPIKKKKNWFPLEDNYGFPWTQIASGPSSRGGAKRPGDYVVSRDTELGVAWPGSCRLRRCYGLWFGFQTRLSPWALRPVSKHAMGDARPSLTIRRLHLPLSFL